MFEALDVAVLFKPLGECSAAELVDRVAATERLAAAVQAEQLRCVHALALTRAAADTGAGVGPRLTGRTVPAEVACARGVSPTTARFQVDLAADLIDDHPGLFDLLAAGRVSLAGVRKVVDATAVLEPKLRREVDANLTRVLAERRLTPGQLGDAAARQVIGVDPGSAERRWEAERAGCRVSVFDKRDGTATVWAKLPAEDAVAVDAALDAEAQSMRAAGDGRSIVDLVCRVFVHRLTSPRAPGVPLQLPADPTRSPVHPRPRRRRRDRRVELQVVMAASTLVGVDDAPATLRGYGSVPAELARRLVEDPDVDRGLRRLLCDPVDGRLLAMDPAARCFSGTVRSFCLWRDQTSRFPYSSTRIREVDHVREYARGGPTTPGNGHGLEKGVHVIRDHPGVSLEVMRGNAPTIRWIMPTGHAYDSDPPPALGYGSSFATPPGALAFPGSHLHAQARLASLRRKLDQVRRT